MYMNMKSITPVNESFKYVLKNLYDGFIEGSNASVKNYVAKMDKVKKEFESMYSLSDKAMRELHKAILAYNAKSKLLEIIDFEKVDKFHHLHLAISMDQDFSKMDLAQVYKVYYKLISAQYVDGYFTGYIHTVVIDNKYVVFISFDEKGIKSVESLASENMFDITANLEVVRLKVNKSIFNKE